MEIQGNQPRNALNRYMGFAICTSVMILQLIVCFCLMGIKVGNQSLFITDVFLGISFATCCLLAIFLAWAPCKGWTRAIIFAVFLMLAFGSCALGNYLGMIFDNSRFGPFVSVFYEGARVLFPFLPAMILSASSPAWISRITRDWKIKRYDPSELEAAPVSQYSLVEIVGYVVVLILSISTLRLEPEFNLRDAALNLGILFPMFFVFGFFVLFPVAVLLLGSKRYLLWAILIPLCCFLVGVGLAVASFATSRQYSGAMSPDVFLASPEFATCICLLLTSGLTVISVLVALRVAGYRLIRPKYEPPPKPVYDTSAVHPLDD